MDLSKMLSDTPIQTSVPCRLDFGGTLDISTFYLPMSHLKPATVNIALDVRTFVTLSAHTPGRVKISSRGFETAEFGHGKAPFNHPMGLMFACAQYFNAHGVHIRIESTSPPRSALGGSSSAAVAILAAFYRALDRDMDPEELAWLAHYIESSVAGVPCGVQDQAAAAYGGVNLWEWRMGRTGPLFERVPLAETGTRAEAMNDNLLVAYCGIPHVSKDINGRWVAAFVRGDARARFGEIVRMTRAFAGAVRSRDWEAAAGLMTEETRIRMEMTPDVLDEVGKKLSESARRHNCGARFTGAGGGGCVWSVGRKSDISGLAGEWNRILDTTGDGKILDARIDSTGIRVEQAS